MKLLVGLLLLGACHPDPAAAPPSDVDGDGVPDASDCAPDDPAVAPGVPEVCDGVDQDCNGVADEGLPRVAWYVDGDGDGHGLVHGAEHTCQPVEGSSATGDDCDDARSDVYPGAPEACDGVDHDCDGATFEADAADTVTWYVDADGDGHGDPTTGTPRCTGEAGLSLVADDCDDQRADVFPGAREVCDGTSTDEDCDGLADIADPDAAAMDRWYVDADRDGEGGPYTAPALGCEVTRGYSYVGTDCDDANAAVYTTTWYADGDHDGYSRDIGGVTSCLPVYAHAPDTRDCDDTHFTAHPGFPDACDDGVDSDCNGVDCWLNVLDQGAVAGQNLGFSIDAGDLTGDGIVDLVAGDFGLAPSGAVVYPGPIGPGLTPGPTFSSLRNAAYVGALVRARDLDGDGQLDLLVGARDASEDGRAGVYLLRGPLLDSFGIDRMENRLLVDAGSTIGGDLDVVPDLTGDGAPDLVLGNPRDEGAGIYVLPAGFDGRVEVDDAATAALLADSSVGRLGWTMEAARDLNGDGVNDIAFEAEDDNGLDDPYRRIYIAFGPVTGIQSAKTVDVVIDGVNEDDPNLGDTVEGVPDLDGDGIDDLVAMSAPDVVVLAPAAAGDYTLWQVTAGRLQDVLDTNTDGQVVGGDFDLDARGDLAISNPADGNDNGVLRVYSGPFLGEVAGSTARGVWEGPDRQMQFGARIANVGDVEGGGRDTLVVTATSPSGAPADAGALFAVLGSEIP